MKRVFTIALILACWLAVSARIHAQAPADNSQSSSSQNKPSPNAPKPAAKPAAGPSSNPFPEDTTSVPVIPTADSPAAPAPAPDYGNIALPNENDPVRSPDETTPPSSSSDSSSSDSAADLDQLLKPPPDLRKDKDHGAEAAPKEGPKEDENVGTYYLESKDWKGALSRFESALVLDPENPDVYWGLAEAQRHLGQFAAAKANYLKVMEYDPDSRHGKDAKKILKEPEMASAHAIPIDSGQQAARPQQ